MIQKQCFDKLCFEHINGDLFDIVLCEGKTVTKQERAQNGWKLYFQILFQIWPISFLDFFMKLEMLNWCSYIFLEKISWNVLLRKLDNTINMFRKIWAKIRFKWYFLLHISASVNACIRFDIRKNWVAILVTMGHIVSTALPLKMTKWTNIWKNQENIFSFFTLKLI